MSDVKVPKKLSAFVSSDTLDAIGSAVKLAEAGTSGEIVVHIVRNLLPLETPRKRAERMFLELGVHETPRRNGVLLLAVMKKRRFEILADEGIAAKTSDEQWGEIAKLVSERIERDGFQSGICFGVEQIGRLLVSHFPGSKEDTDNLPDRPSVEP